MRTFIGLALACLLLSACASTPLPVHNPAMAWVDLETQTGKLVMAERLDSSHEPRVGKVRGSRGSPEH